ncbi:ATP-binding protein [Candidatus Bipolaricaulota bacterium]
MADTNKTTPEELAEKLDHYQATTIPVHIDIDVKHTVLELVEAERILRAATLISLGDCNCRKTKKNCDKPVNVCMVLNNPVEESSEWGDSFREVSVEEALEALRVSHEAGLVHLAYRKNNGDISELCSCCECCCWFLGTLKQYDFHDGVVESSHVARHLREECVACGLCVMKCPFDAWVAEEDGAKPTLNEDRCFGCGVCVTACPSNAIAFVERGQ